jgi:hypothetical protein
MSLAIFNCSPRAKSASNTTKILKAFVKGYETDGNQADVNYLQDRTRWEEYRRIFYESNEMIFAMPLFVECIPGIFMEFLEFLEPKVYEAEKAKTRIAFILQGGFAEANQLRTGEHYLEMLPGYLNCEYAGTLIKGNMFGLALVPEDTVSKMVQPFVEMGKVYGGTHRFDKEKVTAFAAPEHFSKSKVVFMDIIIRTMGKIAFNKVSRNMGAKEKLDIRPYQNEL